MYVLCSQVKRVYLKGWSYYWIPKQRVSTKEGRLLVENHYCPQQKREFLWGKPQKNYPWETRKSAPAHKRRKKKKKSEGKKKGKVINIEEALHGLLSLLPSLLCRLPSLKESWRLQKDFKMGTTIEICNYHFFSGQCKCYA